MTKSDLTMAAGWFLAAGMRYVATAALGLLIIGNGVTAANAPLATVSTLVSRVGTVDGGTQVTLTPRQDGGAVLLFRSWAAPQLVGDHAQSNAVALISDGEGHVLRRVVFRCHKAMTRLAQNLNRQCEREVSIAAETMRQAAWLFAFNRLCVWQERGGQATHHRASCAKAGDTIPATDAFTAKLPELTMNAGDAATIDVGEWRGARLR